MTLQPPFALFVLSDGIDTEYINYSLRRAWRGNFMAGWDFWIASDNHSDMPKFRTDDATVQGSAAPICGSFVSPWVGKSLHDCAMWLRNAPLDSAVNRTFFAVMNEHSKGDDTVLVCRASRSSKVNDVEVEYFPQPTDVVAMHMVTVGGSKFDEKAIKYQQMRKKDGKPDRSSTGSIH